MKSMLVWVLLAAPLGDAPEAEVKPKLDVSAYDALSAPALWDVEGLFETPETYPAPEKILERHALVEDLGCDSLLLVEIAMEAEEQFGIPVPDEFLERIRTVGDVADGVLELLGQPPEG